MDERVLIVEDDPLLAEGIAEVLRAEGLKCDCAPTAEAARELLGTQEFDVLVADVLLPGASGVDLLRWIAERGLGTLAIVMTGHATVESAVEALRLGAYDYVVKPVNLEDVRVRVRRLIEHRDRTTEIRVLRRDLQRSFDFENIVGRTPAMQAVFERIRKVAATGRTILVTGESGTGKELIARALHFGHDACRERPFVAVNCAAIAETLLESELFGHVRGAFTGALGERKGFFEVAEGGTLFLDEIGELNATVQAKLLRAIEQKEIVRVGGTEPVRLNVRIVCSTNRDLAEMVAAKTFRADLYYRINVVEIRLPPLRERREDVSLLVGHFVSRYNRELKRAYRGATPDALRALIEYDWPGNVRELENVIERAMILGDGRAIRTRDLPANVVRRAPAMEETDLRSALAAFERRHIRTVIEAAGGNKLLAARMLGIGLSSLYRKLGEREMSA